MKKIKMVNGLAIYEVSQKAKDKYNINSNYVCYTKDEMVEAIELRNIEWEEDNLQAMEQFCKSY